MTENEAYLLWSEDVIYVTPYRALCGVVLVFVYEFGPGFYDCFVVLFFCRDGGIEAGDVHVGDAVGCELDPGCQGHGQGIFVGLHVAGFYHLIGVHAGYQ